MNNLKYPVAYYSKTKKMVHINDLLSTNVNYDKNFLICKDCNEQFIAVINHPTPHFKHKSDSNCLGNKESYIHWLSKEIFKSEIKVHLPKIMIDDLPERERQKFQSQYNDIIDENIPQNFRAEFKKGLRRNLTEDLELDINLVEIEKTINTEIGAVQVDVSLSNKKDTFFIEPYYSNRISNEKLEKLRLLNITTFSINLNEYLKNYHSQISISSLKKFLSVARNKKWEYIKVEKFVNILSDYKNYLENEIIRFKPYLEYYNNLTKEIGINDEKIQKLNMKIKKLEKEKIKIQNENFKWQKEIDNIFDNYELI